MFVSGINNFFYDIVFDLELNSKTYDFNNSTFVHNSKKNLYLFINILLNILILFFLLFCLLFIEIPIIMYIKSK